MLSALSVLLAVVLTAWLALLVQSLSGAGMRATYFAAELHLVAPPDNDNAVVVTSEFPFVDSNGIRHVAPAGMESDGASVGALLGWPVLGLLVIRLIGGTPLTGPLRPGAIVHDALYARARDTSLWRALISPERALADRVLYEAARCQTYKLGRWERYRDPLPRWRAIVVLAVLRIAGEKAWIDDSRAARTIDRGQQ